MSQSNFLSLMIKLYKLLRVLKLKDVIKCIAKHRIVHKVLVNLRLSDPTVRIIWILIVIGLTVHVMSCFWFLSARYKEFNTYTWVHRLNFLDENPSGLYLESLIWSLQTLATVGYGYFSANTTNELGLSILCMTFGVGMYAYVVGNLSLVIQKTNTKSVILKVSFPSMLN